MVGSLSKDESSITVNTPLLDSPLNLRKPFSVGDNPRTMRSLLEFNQTKRANDKKAKAPAAENQPLGKAGNFISIFVFPSSHSMSISFEHKVLSNLWQLYVVAMIQVRNLDLMKHWLLSKTELNQNPKMPVLKWPERIWH